MKPATYKRIATTRPAAFGSFIKKLLRIKRQVVNTPLGSFYLDPASNLGFTILESGRYEPEVTRAMEVYLTPASTFIDLGANEGYHSIIASRLAKRVIAIEPQERLLPVIQKNIELNACKNIEIISVAISDRIGSASLYLYPEINTGASGLTPTLRYPMASKMVKTTTLEALFDSLFLTTCDLIKIDIEGGEWDAIFGSPDLFKEQRIAALIIEPTDHQLEKQKHRFSEITDFLTSCGYQPDRRFECSYYRQVWS